MSIDRKSMDIQNSVGKNKNKGFLIKYIEKTISGVNNEASLFHSLF